MARDVTLLNASYDPTRELYQDINPAFAAQWKAQHGDTIIIQMSHGGSGKQARSVVARRWQTFARVILPMLTPALLTGSAMALARAVGEYGSVIFIAGNIPGRSEIALLLIVQNPEEFDRLAGSLTHAAMAAFFL